MKSKPTRRGNTCRSNSPPRRRAAIEFTAYYTLVAPDAAIPAQRVCSARRGASWLPRSEKAFQTSGKFIAIQAKRDLPLFAETSTTWAAFTSGLGNGHRCRLRAFREGALGEVLAANGLETMVDWTRVDTTADAGADLSHAYLGATIGGRRAGRAGWIVITP